MEGHGKIIKCKDIRLFDDDLPIGDGFKMNSITIVIESLIEKDNIFYPEIALTLYFQCSLLIPLKTSEN